ncbi:hypothetical protein ACSYAD_06160 [Acaryochloris marina NIES-2412]|uniref:hypothetical protein n=1 Tax=Acaryochloris marina TaxID=155978 RepID=UPI0040585D9C
MENEDSCECSRKLFTSVDNCFATSKFSVKYNGTANEYDADLISNVYDLQPSQSPWWSIMSTAIGFGILTGLIVKTKFLLVTAHWRASLIERSQSICIEVVLNNEEPKKMMNAAPMTR